jgi:mannose-6-phosphate isomerase
MSMITFQPLYQSRLWGGRTLATAYGRPLPEAETIGESWELVDRTEAQSVVLLGSERFPTLHDLWVGRRIDYFGTRAPATPCFPILIKVLDCREKLSVQVHPPERLAAELGGEPKTEMWYFLQTEPEAEIYAGFKKGVTRERFTEAAAQGETGGLLYTLKTTPGEAMFLPSGRVHAIGAGNLILEVQQNSDTAYRVDDWGRLDPKTGQARELHLTKALASIVFADEEPIFVQAHGAEILACKYFTMRRHYIYPGEYQTYAPAGATFHYHFVAQGEITLGEARLGAGAGWLMTADHAAYEVHASKAAELLTVSFS